MNKIFLRMGIFRESRMDKNAICLRLAPLFYGACIRVHIYVHDVPSI